MDRRDTIKSLLVGGLAGGALLTSKACKTANDVKEGEKAVAGYGRQPHEKAIDKKLHEEQFYNEHEMTTIAVLCDIILPATVEYQSASQLEVPAFIEFMSKDLIAHQVPMRGGLMWLDNHANSLHNKKFANCSNAEQLSIVDKIAYESEDPELAHGIQFFNRIRNLTLTGYYTTKEGIEELGYQGNRANVWDGVPPEVLAKHKVDYDKEWLAKCVDQSKRMDIAEWDDNKNLVT